MDNFLFKDEPEEEVSSKLKAPKVWKVLIVDDDEAVHQVTRLVLADADIEHRKLEIHSAYSSEEAKEVLSTNEDFCMVFLDVVMETDDAGLQLVGWIRKELQNQAIRIVLRTGQAGTAPEATVIKEFDINDYKEKTDFTAGKMITTVYASIRAYRDIMTIQRSLNGFKQLITSTHELLKIDQFKAFGSAALDHLMTLMDVESSALYIARNQLDFEQASSDLIIAACTGKYVSESESLESSEIEDEVKKRIHQVFIDKQSYTDEHCFVGYYQTASNTSSVLYIDFDDDSEHFQANLVELFATNVALILEGLSKRHEVDRTQRELLYIVGEAIEARCKTTGSHVKRVALICSLFAEKLGLNEQFVESIKLAAPLHDLGKIAIPERVLNKTSKLDSDEWDVMKTHSEIGSDILKQSTSSVAKLGAKLAKYHHENWDGSGYPEGLSGENIPMEARIMAIADVYDAMGSKRSYREPHSNEQIKDYIISQRGVKFDPKLVDVFVSSFDELISIKQNHPDKA
jgi:response regulator RpfG family c-di-GMP phosphodiesterase